MRSAFLKNLFALLAGTLFAFLLAEGILRIYSPIPFRAKGNKIILPARQKYVFHNHGEKKLDSVIIHTKNSMGFRGPETPADFKKHLSIITVGGSTTECLYLSDGKDWPGLLGKKLSVEFPNIWINNAGLDGNSTFGHQILLEDFLVNIHPNYILYLVGCNEMERFDLSEYDKDILRKNSRSLKELFVKNTEVGALLYNLKHAYDARTKGLTHHVIDLKQSEHVPFDSMWVVNETRRQAPCFLSYESRLTKLIETTKKNGIRPVLITQPSLVGAGIDPVTGVNLETVRVSNVQVSALGRSGKEFWSMLEKYNDVTRQVAAKENVLLIDLARKMPKSSAYFYDGIHYTNEGAEIISSIVYQSLKDALEEAK